MMVSFEEYCSWGRTLSFKVFISVCISWILSFLRTYCNCINYLLLLHFLHNKTEAVFHRCFSDLFDRIFNVLKRRSSAISNSPNIVFSYVTMLNKHALVVMHATVLLKWNYDLLEIDCLIFQNWSECGIAAVMIFWNVTQFKLFHWASWNRTSKVCKISRHDLGRNFNR